MSNPKYSFNPEKLSYDKITRSFKQKVGKILKDIILLAAASFAVFVVMSLLFDTPDEKIQKRENKQLMYQYEALNQKVKKMEESMDEIQQHDNDIQRLIFGIEPTDANNENDSSALTVANSKSNSVLISETAQTIDNLSRRITSQSEVLANIMKMVQDKEKQLASIPAISPIDDRNLKRFASGYGYRIHPIYRTLKMHKGIDLTAPTGTNVYATGNGKVVSANSTADGYGKKVIIDHGHGYKTLYAHLNKITVKAGQRVQRGDVIGEVGSTGRSTAPHLHYEVRKNDRTENPVNYYYCDITPEEYEDILNTSNIMTMSFD